MRTLYAAAFLCFATAFAACGGGGGSSPMPTANPTGSPTPPPTPTPVPTNLPSMATTVAVLPSPDVALTAPVVGPDNGLWFVAWTGSENAFVRFTAASQIFYPIPNSANAGATTIAVGSDNALWSTLGNGPSGLMARTDTSGNVTVYPIPDGSIVSMTVGGDGNLWYLAFTDQKYDAVLRAFSPSTRNIVASLALTAEQLGHPDVSISGRRFLFSNPKDGAILITTGSPAGFLKVVPSSSPTVNNTYATPFSDANIYGTTAQGATIYATAVGDFLLGEPTQLVAMNESTYAMSFTALPNQFACVPGCFEGLSVQGPLSAGPDGNLYAWTMSDQGNGDPNVFPIGFFGVTPSGSIISQSTYGYNSVGGNIFPVGLTAGADENLWATVNWSSDSPALVSAVYEFTPLHASRMRGSRRI